MKAMIFGAGLGTRLKPFTNNKPKALVKLCGKPMLYYVLKKFENIGITTVVINVHHFANQIIKYVSSLNFNLEILISDETDMLLDTGGGLKKAENLLKGNKPIFIHNVDVLTNIDLLEMLSYHNSNNALATLAIRNRETSRHLLFNQNMELKGWKNNKTNQQILKTDDKNLTPFGFSGVHIISPELLSKMPLTTQPYSIINTYLQLCEQNIIKGFNHNNDVWLDLGTPNRLLEAEKLINQNPALL